LFDVRNTSQVPCLYLSVDVVIVSVR